MYEGLGNDLNSALELSFSSIEDIVMKQNLTPDYSYAHKLNDNCRQRLRLLRELLGFSRTTFSELLGIPPTTLKNYELAYREMSGNILLLIAHHPELSTYLPWLMTGKGDMQPGNRTKPHA